MHRTRNTERKSRVANAAHLLQSLSTASLSSSHTGKAGAYVGVGIQRILYILHILIHIIPLNNNNNVHARTTGGAMGGLRSRQAYFS